MSERIFSLFLSLIFGVLTAADGEADGLLLGDEVGALVGENVSDPPPHTQQACFAVKPRCAYALPYNAQ